MVDHEGLCGSPYCLSCLAIVSQRYRKDRNMTLRLWLDQPPATRASAWMGQTHIILYHWQDQSYEIRDRNVLRDIFCPNRAAVEMEWRRMGRSLHELGTTY